MLIFLLFLGCAPEHPDYLSFHVKYGLIPTWIARVELDGSEGRHAIPPCRDFEPNYEDEELALCTRPSDTAISIHFWNRTDDRPFEIDYAKSTYVDEEGGLHELSRDEGEKLVVPPGTRVVGLFAPAGKSYRVRTSLLMRDGYIEPLIPFSFGSRDDQEVEAYLDRIAAEGKEVGLDLLGRLGSEPVILKIRFALKPIYAEKQWKEQEDLLLQ